MGVKGNLFVVSAPSGTGKTTLVETLVSRVPGLQISCSYTSRPPRPGEEDGVDYHFVNRGQFEAMRSAGDLLEWAEVFGHLYGTSVIDTKQRLDGGVDLVLVIDVKGASQVRRLDEAAVGIFVLPPSPEILETRLRCRSDGHLSEEQVARRLTVARTEVESMGEYDYVVVNDVLETCVEELRSIVVASRASRASRRVANLTATAIAHAFQNTAPRQR